LARHTQGRHVGLPLRGSAVGAHPCVRPNCVCAQFVRAPFVRRVIITTGEYLGRHTGLPLPVGKPYTVKIDQVVFG
jgi:hypothetical protein